MNAVLGLAVLLALQVESKTCTSGTYTLNSGASCSECPIGTYSPVPQDIVSCPACPANTYTTSVGSSACTSCGTCTANFYRSGCGGSLPGTCVNCPVCYSDNYYLSGCSGNSPGTCTPCPACPAGSYNTGCTGGSPGTCTPCPTCSQGYYNPSCSGTYSGMCVQSSSLVVAGSPSTEGFCDFTKNGPFETYVSSGNTLIFNDLAYNTGTCNVLIDSGRVRITQQNAISIILKITGSLNPYNNLDNVDVSSDPTINANSNSGVGLIWTFTQYVNAYYQYNATYEVALNTIYVSYASSTSQGGDNDPLFYTNVSYWWRYPCATCPANQYTNGCSSTSQGTCSPCKACSNGYYPAGCGGTSPGVCSTCNNTN